MVDTKKYPQIGKGNFSTVYRKSSKKVLIKSRDKVKECMSNKWFPSTLMFPEIDFVAMCNEPDYKFYESRYYPKVNSIKNNLSPFEWGFYKELRNRLKYKCGYKDLCYAVHTLPTKYTRKKEQLLDAISALSNYGDDFVFEISPRNVAVRNGRLVLLDCFYFSEDRR